LRGNLLAQDDSERLGIIQVVTDNISLIFNEAMATLSQDPEEPLRQSSKLYINHHLSSFCDDMILVLKQITAMMFDGYPEPQAHQFWDYLKSKYIDLGVPVSDVIRAIESLKEVTLNVLASDEKLIDLLGDSDPILIRSEKIELISEIKKNYLHKWVTVEVIELERGFPTAGKIILAGKNRNRIAEEIFKHYRDVKTYTFYCGDLSEEVSPVRLKINGYLEPYFDSVIKKLKENV